MTAQVGSTSDLALDHLVVAASTLDQGVAWCKATLGVEPGPGGRHALMGTHNRLLKIASPTLPQAYLEIIAIDPDAAPLGRVRWFGLDEPALQAQLLRAPRLLHVVVRTGQLERHLLALRALGQQPGEPVHASRQTPQGLLPWQIALRSDGRLGCGGALPTLIQWDGRHPADGMPDAGVSLRSLQLRGLMPPLQAALQIAGVEFGPGAGPALCANLSTPLGDVSLESA